jgi:hypothetical protein
VLNARVRGPTFMGGGLNPSDEADRYSIDETYA